MTTKKFAKEVEKRLKNIINISVENMFEDYVLYQNGKRIGVLFNNQVLLIGTKELHDLYPNLVQEKSFDWGYYKLFHIDLGKLEEAVKITYKALYFNEGFATDLSGIILAYSHYPSIMVNIYDTFVTFLKFCEEKNLLRQKALDSNNRIIKMNFINNDLTEQGQNIFVRLLDKWLGYNDKIDQNSEMRRTNVKMLEKYYLQLKEKK